MGTAPVSVHFLSSRGRALLSYCCCDLYFIHPPSSLHITGHECVSSTCEESFLLHYLSSSLNSHPPFSLPSPDALRALTHVPYNAAAAATPSLLKLPMASLTALAALPILLPSSSSYFSHLPSSHLEKTQFFLADS